MKECGGRCCGERAESLPRDGAGRRGGEGDEGLGEKWSAFKHLSELAVLRGGCPPQGSAGHCLAGRWPSGAPRNAPTPAMSLKKAGEGGETPFIVTVVAARLPCPPPRRRSAVPGFPCSPPSPPAAPPPRGSRSPPAAPRPRHTGRRRPPAH